MNEEWKDMQQIWAQNNPGAPDANEVLRHVARRSARFDRGVRWRNAREWLGGLAGLAMIASLAGRVETVVEVAFLASMALLLIAVCGHLWVTGRAGAPANPALSRERYREMTERKFARQIRTMEAAKYWFLVPLGVTGAATAWTYLYGKPGGEDWLYFPLIVVGALIAWWSNEACGVRKARREWEQIRRALDDGEIPEQARGASL